MPVRPLVQILAFVLSKKQKMQFDGAILNTKSERLAIVASSHVRLCGQTFNVKVATRAKLELTRKVVEEDEFETKTTTYFLELFAGRFTCFEDLKCTMMWCPMEKMGKVVRVTRKRPMGVESKTSPKRLATQKPRLLLVGGFNLVGEASNKFVMCNGMECLEMPSMPAGIANPNSCVFGNTFYVLGSGKAFAFDFGTSAWSAIPALDHVRAAFVFNGQVCAICAPAIDQKTTTLHAFDGKIWASTSTDDLDIQELVVFGEKLCCLANGFIWVLHDDWQRTNLTFSSAKLCVFGGHLWAIDHTEVHCCDLATGTKLQSFKLEFRSDWMLQSWNGKLHALSVDGTKGFDGFAWVDESVLMPSVMQRHFSAAIL